MTTSADHSSVAPRFALRWSVARAHLARHWVLWVLALAFVGHLTVVWGTTYLPLGDLGGHVELMDIMARSSDPRTIYPELYVTRSPLTANGLSLCLAVLLARLIGTLNVAKLLLTWFVIGTPLSALALARAFKRPDWTALLATPLVFGALLNVGFLNFIASLPFLLFAVAVARKFAAEGGLRRGLLLFLLLQATYFAHILGYLIALGMVGAVMLVFVPGLRAWRRWLALVASTPFFAAWSYQRLLAGQATEAGRTIRTAGGGFGAEFLPWDRRLQLTHEWGMRFFKDNVDEVAFLLMVVVWLLAMAATGRDSASNAGVAEAQASWWKRMAAALREYAVEWITLSCMAAFFLLPNNIREVNILAERAWFFTLVFFAFWPRIQPRSWRFGVLIAPLLAVVLGYPWVVHSKFQEFQRRYVGGLPAAIAALPDRTALAYVMEYPEIDLTHMGPLWHLPKMLQATLNGGHSDDCFAIRPYYPIDYRPGRTPSPLGRPFWRAGNLDDYDYVLVLSHTKPTEALASNRVKLRWHELDWWLFDVVLGPARASRP